MSEETATVETAATGASASARASVYGLRKQANWLQLVRFGLVGASGYVVNLAVFALCVGALSLGHRAAAVLAFAGRAGQQLHVEPALDVRGARPPRRSQAFRFCVVSLCAFAFSFAVLEVLVRGLRRRRGPAQAVAIATATPLNFIGNKLWASTGRSAATLLAALCLLAAGLGLAVPPPARPRIRPPSRT